MTFFLRGLLIGLAIAAPVGAIGVLCIRRTLAHGRTIGLATGLGAATADAFYGAVAAFGLTAITSFVTGHAAGLRLVGGAVLLVLGWRTFVAEPNDCNAPDEARAWPAYASTFVLTLTNPTTIISFTAVFAGLGLAGTGGGGTEAAWLVLGVFCGSAAWWLILSGVVSLVRERVGTSAMRTINRVSGAIIAGLGVVAIAAGVSQLV